MRTHKAQLVIIFALFFFFISFFSMIVVQLYDVQFFLLPAVGTVIFALLSLFVLFIWKKSPTEVEQMGPLLDALVEGVVVIDRRFRVRMINRQAAGYLEVKSDSIVGHSFEEIRQPACINLVRQALKLRQPVMAVVKPEQTGRLFDVTAICREKQNFVILVIQDQTNIHKAVELARDFIANASHELKTPITIIRGFAETLCDHPELSKEVTQGITRKIRDNCDRMVALVKNLLTLAAIDEGIPHGRLQKCNLMEVAEKARATILAIHPTATISLKQEKPVIMTGDKDLIIQAMINLLDNAVKYSSSKAKVDVELLQNDFVSTIKVQDYGRGIAKENLSRIFERFYAIDKTLSRSLGGYGLGLSIVARIVEKHHGHIEVLSEEGKGSTFILTFPHLTNFDD